LKITDNRPKRDFCAGKTTQLCKGTTITREDAGAIAKQQAQAYPSPQISEPFKSAPTSESPRPTPSTSSRPKPNTLPTTHATLRGDPP
jgi:hypothetical protein